MINMTGNKIQCWTVLLLSCYFVFSDQNQIMTHAWSSGDVTTFAMNTQIRSRQFSSTKLYYDTSDSEYSLTTTEDVSRRNFMAQIATCGAIIVTTTMANEDNAAMAMMEPPIVNNDNNSVEEYNVIESSSNVVGATAVAAVGGGDAMSVKQVLDKSLSKALGGGKAGASAAVVQVLTLMWLRTAMNYQYRFGGTLQSSLDSLYKEGGIGRLYQGLPFALVQGPLSRFGDTAANVGILAVLESYDTTAELPLFVKTACASIAAGSWRIFCMPIDTSKTVLQVQGPEGLQQLKDNIIETKSIQPLYRGAVASAAATAVGHFPWFLTFNYFNEILPVIGRDEDILLSLARSAGIGLISSCVSDCTSNSLRVLKITKQTSGRVDGEEELTYKEALNSILETDGWKGLLGRGLQTRLLTNAIQGAVFSILWKYFQIKG